MGFTFFLTAKHSTDQVILVYLLHTVKLIFVKQVVN